MVYVAKGEAMIAPTASAIRVAGKDGALRVTLEISGTTTEVLAAAAEWASLVGIPFAYTTTPITPTRYGERTDDGTAADDD